MVTVLKIIEKVSKISGVIIFALAFSSVAFVNANTSDEYYEEEESIYKYNALENRSSFAEMERLALLAEEEIAYPTESETTFHFHEEWQSLIEKRNFSIGEISKAMDALKDRSGMKTFLVGNNLAALRFQLVQIREIATLLDALSGKTEDESIKIQIDKQIKFLRQEQEKVEGFILRQKNEFSLFGWFVSML